MPYQGVAPALTDLAGGQIETMFAAVSVPLPLIKQGQLRAIAYSGDSRNPLLPDVPTFIELGLTGFTSKGFQGIFVPRGTPPEVVAKLRTTVQAIVSSASFQKNVIAANGFEPPNVSPTELESFVTSHLTASKALIDPIRGQFDLK